MSSILKALKKIEASTLKEQSESKIIIDAQNIIQNSIKKVWLRKKIVNICYYITFFVVIIFIVTHFAALNTKNISVNNIKKDNIDKTTTKQTEFEEQDKQDAPLIKPKNMLSYPSLKKLNPKIIHKDSNFKPPNFRLQAVAYSDKSQKSIAVINNQVLHKGESINGALVKHINKEFVVMAIGENEWEIKFRQTN